MTHIVILWCVSRDTCLLILHATSSYMPWFHNLYPSAIGIPSHNFEFLRCTCLVASNSSQFLRQGLRQLSSPYDADFRRFGLKREVHQAKGTIFQRDYLGIGGLCCVVAGEGRGIKRNLQQSQNGPFLTCSHVKGFAYEPDMRKVRLRCHCSGGFKLSRNCTGTNLGSEGEVG